MKWRSRQTERNAAIDIDGISYPVRIRPHPAARSVKLRYDALAGEVRITVPEGISERAALRMAEDHRCWLKREMARAVAPVLLGDGALLALEGHTRRISWSPDNPRRAALDEDIIHIGGEEALIQIRLVRWLKQLAREGFAADLEHYCSLASKSVPPLGIGDPRTRWGSCSTRSGIRLNWRLIMAPIAVRRSVVAHEVAHLTHMNHSPLFHAYLEKLFEGDISAADAWLRRHGAGLRAVGASRSPANPK